MGHFSWYNFLQKRKSKLYQRQKSVLVTGSSVALYSYLPQRVDEELEKRVKIQSDFSVMSPCRLLIYIIMPTDDFKKLILILYLVNPGDLQNDHFKVGESFMSIQRR